MHVTIIGQFVTPPGTYTVTAVSTLHNMRANYRNGGADYTGKTISAPYTITLAPLINFQGTPTSGTVPLTVQFNVTQTVPGANKWNWTFGDGGNFTTTVSAQRNATHTYRTPGDYTVNLSITSPNGTV